MSRGYYRAPKVGVGASLGLVFPAGLLTAVAVALSLVVVARSHAFDEHVLAAVALAAPWIVVAAAVLVAGGVCRVMRVRWHAIALTTIGLCAIVATATGWIARAVVVAGGAPDTAWPPDAHAAATGLVAAIRHGLVEAATIGPLSIALIVAEALIIAAASVWLARRWLGPPVCRGCGSWCRPHKGSAWASAAAPRDAERVLRDRDWDALRRGTASSTGPRRVRLDLQLCRSCGHLRSMNAWWIYPVVGSVKLISDMLLAEDEVRTVRDLGTARHSASRAA